MALRARTTYSLPRLAQSSRSSLLRQGPVDRLDVNDAGVELDAGRLELLDRHVGSHAKAGIFLPYADDVIELLEDPVGYRTAFHRCWSCLGCRLYVDAVPSAARLVRAAPF